MSLRILITGAKGQLATEFIQTCENNGIEYKAFSKEELDITNFSLLLKIVRELKPTHIINCAAYNLVDKAETEPTDAYKVNAVGAYNLAVACVEIGAVFVHYSTDYVFDGKKEAPYVEEDQPNPLNEYGKSKLLGERLIQQNMDKYLIFRTSWVYGKGKQNFLYKLTQWAQSQEYLRIACDEFSVPTSTRTIVEVTLEVLKKGLRGLYHLVNSGYASRYEWTKEYFRLKGIKKFIYPAYQNEFNLPAKRPKWSAMSNEKICKELDTEIREWENELRRIINEGEI
ncbi:MAG: dTDP-4-dehydrorhamnose reductase [Thermodesulfovibrio sp.]|nr:dTDP-4-dehydrorhamnose reductase [Thermodesulfovibrio sp.]MDW7998979.1 dTDP-4-dehydrorhamnose reductase [Thermodesulfovibrio sp.]